MVVDPREAAREAPLIGVGGPGEEAAGAPIRQASLWRDALRRYMRNRGALIAVNAVLVAAAIPVADGLIEAQ